MRIRVLICGWLLAACVVPVWAGQNSSPTIAEAYRLLEMGEIDRARAAFESIADRDPSNKAAWEGVTWTALRKGAIDVALRAARKREGLDPSDDAWRRKRLNIMLDSPDWRNEAVRELRVMVAQRPDDPETRFLLARALSLFLGQQTAAVKHYRAGLAMRDEAEARLGLARALAWSGQGEAAAIEYDKLLADDPDLVDALVGRAQVARWHGELGLARRLNTRALEQAPDDSRPHLELARVALNEDRPHAARSHALRGRKVATDTEKADEVLDEIAKVRAPRLLLFGTQHEEPLSGFERRSSGAMFDLRLIGELETRLEGSFSRFEDGVEKLDRVTAGLHLRYPLPRRVALWASFRNHRFQNAQEDDDPSNAWSLGLQAHAPNAPLTVRLGIRQRLLVDPPVDESRVAPFYESGTGGMTLDAIRDQVEVREAHATISGSPVRGAFLYAVGSVGRVDKTNDRTSVVAGGGYDLGRVIRLRSHRFIVGYSLYYLDYAHEDERYFSPEGFFVQGFNLGWRWKFGETGVIGLGTAYSRNKSGDAGGSYTGYLALPVGRHLRFEARSRYFDNTVFRTVTTTLLMNARF